MRSSARASVLTVVPALVDLAPLPDVAGLAATLGHLASVQEAAPAVQTLDVTGLRGGGCWEKSAVTNGPSESSLRPIKWEFALRMNTCFIVCLPPGVTVPACKRLFITKTHTNPQIFIIFFTTSGLLIFSHHLLLPASNLFHHVCSFQL